MMGTILGTFLALLLLTFGFRAIGKFLSDYNGGYSL